MIPAAQFRAYCDNLTPDQVVQLSHFNRNTLSRAIRSIACNSRIGLEIGCYKGDTTVWLLQNGLDAIDVIDTFRGSPELKGSEHIEADFRRATASVGHKIHKILKGPSVRMLGKLDPKYGFIYIDGSHDSRDVIVDAALAWRVLEPGGVMVFDDYQWNYFDDSYRNPAPAVDFFLQAWADDLTVVDFGYQVVVSKKL